MAFLLANACELACSRRASSHAADAGSAPAVITNAVDSDDAVDAGLVVTEFAGRRGVIVPASMAVLIDRDKGAWTPGLGVIRELEKGIDAYLHEEVPDFAGSMAEARTQVQYEGTVRDDERVVQATYFLDDPAAPDPPWGATLPRIQADGCWIEVSYWPKARKFQVSYESSLCGPTHETVRAP